MENIVTRKQQEITQYAPSIPDGYQYAQKPLNYVPMALSIQGQESGQQGPIQNRFADGINRLSY